VRVPRPVSARQALKACRFADTSRTSGRGASAGRRLEQIDGGRARAPAGEPRIAEDPWIVLEDRQRVAHVRSLTGRGVVAWIIEAGEAPSARAVYRTCSRTDPDTRSEPICRTRTSAWRYSRSCSRGRRRRTCRATRTGLFHCRAAAVIHGGETVARLCCCANAVICGQAAAASSGVRFA